MAGHPMDAAASPAACRAPSPRRTSGVHCPARAVPRSVGRSATREAVWAPHLSSVLSAAKIQALSGLG